MLDIGSDKLSYWEWQTVVLGVTNCHIGGDKLSYWEWQTFILGVTNCHVGSDKLSYWKWQTVILGVTNCLIGSDKLPYWEWQIVIFGVTNCHIWSYNCHIGSDKLSYWEWQLSYWEWQIVILGVKLSYWEWNCRIGSDKPSYWEWQTVILGVTLILGVTNCHNYRESLRAGRSEIESLWGRDLPHPSRPTLRPTQPTIQWSTWSLPGVKRPVRDVDHPLPSSAEVKERLEAYIYSSSGSSWFILR